MTHVGEVATDPALVRRLLAGQFPQWAGLPIERFPSAGTVNAVYRLGDDMAVRLPRPESGAADVVKEQHWLPRLAPLLPFAVPAVLGRGEPAKGYPWPWSVCRWLDGGHPDAHRLTEPTSLAADLARFVTAMRRVDFAREPAPAAYRGGRLATQDGATRTALAELRAIGGCGIDTTAATAAWDAALRAPEWDGPPVWLHGDLMPGNLLIDGAGRLSAVIDFGTVGVGDPSCDLIVTWFLLPAGVRDTFRAALGVEDATWARGRGRALSMALNALPYYRHTNPVMAAHARHAIREVVADGPDGA